MVLSWDLHWTIDIKNPSSWPINLLHFFILVIFLYIFIGYPIYFLFFFYILHSIRLLYLYLFFFLFIFFLNTKNIIYIYKIFSINIWIFWYGYKYRWENRHPTEMIPKFNITWIYPRKNKIPWKRKKYKGEEKYERGIIFLVRVRYVFTSLN